MLYASSKDALVKKLNIGGNPVQGTDFDEVEYGEILKRAQK
jgi:hypothetical protein